jgi:hypothetical protein
MPVVYPTTRIYHGGKAAGSMFKDDEQVWPYTDEPPDEEFSPLDLPNLTVWIDASTLDLNDGDPVSPWPDQSPNENDGIIIGTPAPVLKAGTLNGKPVVRFKMNEGRVRGDGMCAFGTWNLTVIYVGRMWGPNVGRIFTNTYPPHNFLIGTHTAGSPTTEPCPMGNDSTSKII